MLRNSPMNGSTPMRPKINRKIPSRTHAGCPIYPSPRPSPHAPLTPDTAPRAKAFRSGRRKSNFLAVATDLSSDERNVHNVQRSTGRLHAIGSQDRYCDLHNTKNAYRDLDYCSADRNRYMADYLCLPFQSGSFEEGMGA